MDVQKMTAPCGLACWACAYYKDNITDELAQQVAGKIGIDAKEMYCGGCRSEKGCSFGNALTGGEGCPTKNCVTDKGLHNCSECTEFPCDKLMPVVENAGAAPHNTKIYNLSRIKRIGLEAWGEEAAMIQKKYFKGRFVYGTSPALDEE
ncbi:MAG: DUF3795 domain-containing protein [Desulfocapsaceae bacterium]